MKYGVKCKFMIGSGACSLWRLRLTASLQTATGIHKAHHFTNFLLPCHPLVLFRLVSVSIYCYISEKPNIMAQATLPPLNPLLKVSGKRTHAVFASSIDDSIKEEEKRRVSCTISFRVPLLIPL